MKLSWTGCCSLLLIIGLVGACRTTGGGGKGGGKDPTDPNNPTNPTDPNNPGSPGACVTTDTFKTELLKQGVWIKDGDQWKTAQTAAMIFKSVALAQEKPELLQTAGQDTEEKWSKFYTERMRISDQGLSLAEIVRSCP